VKVGRTIAVWCLALMVMASVGSMCLDRAWAADSASTLTPAQEARAAALESKLIAPCCWVQTVDLHQSDAAEQVKAQIRMLVAQGKGENEILDSFVAQYGEKILASPRARGFNAIVYVLPLLVFFIAAGAVTVLLIRWRRRPPPVASFAAGAPVPISPADEALRTRLEDELSHFDS
jgi:cytochrome c-type biogenesis protein CcmH